MNKQPAKQKSAPAKKNAIAAVPSTKRKNASSVKSKNVRAKKPKTKSAPAKKQKNSAKQKNGPRPRQARSPLPPQMQTRPNARPLIRAQPRLPRRKHRRASVPKRTKTTVVPRHVQTKTAVAQASLPFPKPLMAAKVVVKNPWPR